MCSVCRTVAVVICSVCFTSRRSACCAATVPVVALEMPDTLVSLLHWLLQVGITQRPVRQNVTSMRPSPLLMLRTNTPRFGLGASAGHRPGALGSTGGV